MQCKQVCGCVIKHVLMHKWLCPHTEYSFKVWKLRTPVDVSAWMWLRECIISFCCLSLLLRSHLELRLSFFSASWHFFPPHCLSGFLHLSSISVSLSLSLLLSLPVYSLALLSCLWLLRHTISDLLISEVSSLLIRWKETIFRKTQILWYIRTCRHHTSQCSFDYIVCICFLVTKGMFLLIISTFFSAVVIDDNQWRHSPPGACNAHVFMCYLKRNGGRESWTALQHMKIDTVGAN